MLRHILAILGALVLMVGCSDSAPAPAEDSARETVEDPAVELPDPAATYESPQGLRQYYIFENPDGRGQVLVTGPGPGLQWAMYDTLDWFPEIAEFTIHDRGYVTWFFESGRSGPLVMAGRIDADGMIRDVHPLVGVLPDQVGEYDFGSDPAFVMTAERKVDLDPGESLVEVFEGSQGRLRFDGGWHTGPTLGADPACGASTLYKATPGGFARVLVPDVEVEPVVQVRAGPVHRDGDADSFLEARAVAILARCPESAVGAKLYLGYEFTGWGEGLVPVEHQVRPEPIILGGLAEIVEMEAKTTERTKASEEPRLPVRLTVRHQDDTTETLVLAPYPRVAPTGPDDTKIWVRDRLDLDPIARSTGVVPLDAGPGTDQVSVASCRLDGRTWTYALDVGLSSDQLAQYRVAVGWWDEAEGRIVRAFETVVTAAESGRVEVVHSPGADEGAIDDLALYWRFAAEPTARCGLLVQRLDRPGVPYATLVPSEATSSPTPSPVAGDAETAALARPQVQADRTEFARLGDWVDPARVSETSARVLADDVDGIRVVAATDWLETNVYVLAYVPTDDVGSTPQVRVSGTDAFAAHGIFISAGGTTTPHTNFVFVPDSLVELAETVGTQVGPNLFVTALSAGEVRASFGAW